MGTIIKAALGLAAVLASIQTAQANVIYNLSNVTLSSSSSGGTPEGTLTGFFTTNDARTMLIAYDITASAFGNFTGFEYTPTTAPVSASTLPSQYFQLDSAQAIDELRIYFSAPLTAAGATIASAFSYESERAGGNRFVSGSVVAAAATAVPEPASLALLAAGLLTVGVAYRRKA